MEISDYLRIVRKRLWILLLVPVLAGGIVTGLVLAGGPRYVATATVAAPALVGGPSSNQYSGSGGPRTFVANFVAAATSSRIVNQVAAETKVPVSRIGAGLDATPIGVSSLIQITYQSPRRPETGPVAGGVASGTIRFLFQSQVRLAEGTVAEASKSVAAADAKLAGFYRSTGMVVPDKLYEIKSQQLANLQAQQAQSQADGNFTAAATLGATIRSKEGELRTLVPRVATYQSLIDRKQQATQQLNLMQQSLDQARAQYSAADPSAVVSLGQTRRVSPGTQVLRKAGPAAGAGLFLAAGIVLLLELLARRPRPTVEVEPEPDVRAELAARPAGLPELEARSGGRNATGASAGQLAAGSSTHRS